VAYLGFWQEMKAKTPFKQYGRQSLRRARWFVFLVASLLVVLGEIYNYFGLGISLFPVVIDLLIGLLIAGLMTQLGFRYFFRLQNDLRQAIVNLEAAEMQLHWQSAALASAANAIVITDGHGRITWINPAFTQLTGYLPDEAIGQSPNILKSGQHDDAFYAQMWQTIMAGNVWRGELVNRRKDGSLYTEDQTITPVMDEQGQISQFIAIKQDMTRRKTMQEAECEQRVLAEALREAGLALSSTLDLDEVMDILLDQIGRVVPYDTVSLLRVVNGRAVIARARGNDPFPKRFQEPENVVFVIEETPYLLQLIQSRQAMIIPDTEKYAGWLKIGVGGHIRSWMGAPIVIEGEIFAMLTLDKQEPDFYLPKHARVLSAFAVQASLMLHNARLFEETRQRARELDLLNRIIAATAVAENEAEMLQVGCVELARYFAAPQAVCAMLGEDLESVHIVAESLAGELPSLIDARIPVKGNPILQHSFDTAVPITYSDVRQLALPPEMAAVLTERRMISVLMIPISLREQIVGAIGVHSPETREFSERDVHLALTVGEEIGQSLEAIRLNDRLRSHAAELERRVAERTQELAEANERLHQLDRLKSKFVSDVSHELRTPITNLTMYLDLLERGRADKRDHYVTVLQKETARIRQLVEDILDLSRLDASREQGIVFTPVDVNQIVGRVVMAQMPQVNTAGLQLNFEPGDGLPPVMGAENQLTQVATNLLTNAIHYTPQGKVEVKTYLENGEVCLMVQDTGMGIDEVDMPHIFERFYRGQRVAQLGVPGTGLGLGIVKEIVDLHGGRAEATSKVGQGSTFRVWLAAVKGER
jgi:PAS domain S-box-containing protein